MQPFDLDVLIFPAATIFIATLGVSALFTRDLVASLLLALLKSGIFTIYFSFIFDGTHTFLDDWTYLAGGKELLLNGVGLENLVQNWDEVTRVSRGRHFVYYLYNAYAIRIFGDAYFSPVAFNIVLTTAIAGLGTVLARAEFRINRYQSKWFYAFLLMHPDVLVWSTVMNGKDTLVLLAHVLLLLAVSLLFRGRLLQALLIALPTVLTLSYLRFYVPPLFALALVLGISLSKLRFQIRYCLIWVCAIAGLLLVMPDYVSSGINVGWLQGSLSNPIFGLLRTTLTPIPFLTEVSYQFLDVPALIHWILMPFVALGVVRVWRIRSPFSRVFLACLLVFIGLYTVTEELQGPRQRFQLLVAFAALQFIGVLEALRRTGGETLNKKRLQ